VKEWVGHSSLRTTSRYPHFRDDFRGEIARGVALFPQEIVEEKLPSSLNSRNFVENSTAASAL
jgi:hypothetical protein